jgi:plasmid stabilization system protein ParE
MKRRVRPAFYLDVSREELWLLEHAGSEIADRWHEALWKALEFLENHPFIGRERRDLKHSHIRSWRINGFERWLIFYGVHDDVIVFYRVVPGSMNLFKLRFY